MNFLSYFIDIFLVGYITVLILHLNGGDISNNGFSFCQFFAM